MQSVHAASIFEAQYVACDIMCKVVVLKAFFLNFPLAKKDSLADEYEEEEETEESKDRNEEEEEGEDVLKHINQTKAKNRRKQNKRRKR